jgi:hypothetical protein
MVDEEEQEGRLTLLMVLFDNPQDAADFTRWRDFDRWGSVQRMGGWGWPGRMIRNASLWTPVLRAFLIMWPSTSRRMLSVIRRCRR